MKSLAMYHPMDSLRTLVDIDRLVDSFFGNALTDKGGALLNKMPTVNVRETNDKYMLEAALPGYDEKDIEVHLNGGTLTIQSKKEKDDEKKNEEGNYIFRERYTESFSRAFKLPENADPEKIEAEFKNGLLILDIKKRSEAQKRVIDIRNK